MASPAHVIRSLNVLFHFADSPSNESPALQRSRRTKDKPSPIAEEEESDSSSAKEDDVEMPEQNRTTPQKKPNRRKRKDRSPFEKADSKESAEEDESVGEYRAQSWRERNRNSPCEKLEGKTKNEGKRREKSKTPKQPGSAKNKVPDDRKGRNDEDDGIGPSEKIDKELQDEKSVDTSDSDGAKKRRNEPKYQQGRHFVKDEDEDLMTIEMFDEDGGHLLTEDSNSPMDYNQDTNHNIDNKSTDVDVKMDDGDNNNMKEISELTNTDEIIGMERVVDILQQAAAINAEKERNLESMAGVKNDSKSPSCFVTPEKDRERRRKRKERKRRKRAPSCNVDASESENSLMSPAKSNKDQNNSLDKEKFDFVSDLGECFVFYLFRYLFQTVLNVYQQLKTKRQLSICKACFKHTKFFVFLKFFVILFEKCLSN